MRPCGSWLQLPYMPSPCPPLPTRAGPHLAADVASGSASVVRQPSVPGSAVAKAIRSSRTAATRAIATGVPSRDVAAAAAGRRGLRLARALGGTAPVTGFAAGRSTRPSERAGKVPYAAETMPRLRARTRRLSLRRARAAPPAAPGRRGARRQPGGRAGPRVAPLQRGEGRREGLKSSPRFALGKRTDRRRRWLGVCVWGARRRREGG
mmetsp:Transcript_4971/g.15089  ORF Transcript_4971/g.15089 Transcript_4971/m.15089 type:complete len:208 (-) Transcript_4971:63-686(-)